MPYRFAVQCVHQASDALTCGQTLLHIMFVSPYLFISLCLPDLVRNHAMQHNARLASFHVLQNPTGPQVWTGAWGPAGGIERTRSPRSCQRLLGDDYHANLSGATTARPCGDDMVRPML